MRKWMFTLILGVCLTACSSAPVQELSDARQSIQAAYDAGAPEHAAGLLSDAESAMAKAKAYLDAGEYRSARKEAEQAKTLAMRAREKALTQAGQ